MVSIPEFIELVSKKVDCATDLSILKKKRESIKAEYAKYYNNLMVNEKRLAELDTGDKHYDRRVDSLNRVMDDLYEKIDDSQSRLDELDNEIAMAEKSALTKQSIFEMLEGFSKYYDVMTPEDRKALLQAMISYIELYGEKRADGHFVKAIVIFRSGMAAIHSQHISHSVINYSYDELLCFWTHRINYFDIFSYFHKSVMYCVLRILFMVQTLIGDIVHKPTVFPVYVFEFALVFFCLDRLKINQHSLGSLPVMLVL